MDLKMLSKDWSKDEKILKRFTINLNEQAELDKLDPIIGRETEINRLIQILSRKTKNNPVLIGEPGVGKTAIAEGLAQRIIKKDVPKNLVNKIIYQLDMGSLIAGAKFQGEFEDRLKAVLEKIKENPDTVILFIDELHLIVGAGRNQGSMDAANLLKPMLAKGELRCIGATTFDEYHQYLEKDGALERRFQKIIVNEPNEEATISILRGLKERFEAFHGVVIHDKALTAATKLSSRYITDRFLPDKAIDLIDEACATIKTQIDSKPLALDNLNRKIIQLEIEKAALSKEKDKQSVIRLTEINNELNLQKQHQTKLQTQWEKESNEIRQIKNLKNQIEVLKTELERAPMSGDFARAGEIQYSILPALNSELEQKQQQNKQSHLLKEDVNENDVAQIVARWTGIKVERLVETERHKLIHLKTKLAERIKGQDKSLQVLTDAILRSRSGIQDPRRPIGSFFFLGPTGVGKTAVAVNLADILFDSNKNMIRLDMSEYMERHSVSKLIGSPPGYVGYEKGGTLTQAVRHQPYSIVLFDEIEKAHPDVINILLQIIDEGQLTDNLGKHVNFKNTIIIMTSNLGAQSLISEYNDDTNKAIEKELAKALKPELINRIDNIVVFNALSKAVIKQIIGIELANLSERIFDLKMMRFTFRAVIIDYILQESYSKEFGARPIKRFIAQNIETYIANEIIRGNIKSEHNYVLNYENRKLNISKRNELN